MAAPAAVKELVLDEILAPYASPAADAFDGMFSVQPRQAKAGRTSGPPAPLYRAMVKAVVGATPGQEVAIATDKLEAVVGHGHYWTHRSRLLNALAIDFPGTPAHHLVVENRAKSGTLACYLDSTRQAPAPKPAKTIPTAPF